MGEGDGAERGECVREMVLRGEIVTEIHVSTERCGMCKKMVVRGEISLSYHKACRHKVERNVGVQEKGKAHNKL